MENDEGGFTLPDEPHVDDQTYAEQALSPLLPVSPFSISLHSYSTEVAHAGESGTAAAGARRMPWRGISPLPSTSLQFVQSHRTVSPLLAVSAGERPTRDGAPPRGSASDGRPESRRVSSPYPVHPPSPVTSRPPSLSLLPLCCQARRGSVSRSRSAGSTQVPLVVRPFFRSHLVSWFPFRPTRDIAKLVPTCLSWNASGRLLAASFGRFDASGCENPCEDTIGRTGKKKLPRQGNCQMRTGCLVSLLPCSLPRSLSLTAARCVISIHPRWCDTPGALCVWSVGEGDVSAPDEADGSADRGLGATQARTGLHPPTSHFPLLTYSAAGSLLLYSEGSFQCF